MGTKMKKLTKEQQELVIDYHDYIYYMCHKYNLDINEYYDIFAIGLCKAAMTYDPSMGYKFTTYLHKVLYMRYIKNIDYKKMKKRCKYIEVSLETPIDNTDNLYLKDTITNNLDLYDECIFLDFSKLKNTHKNVLILRSEGYSSKEISALLNMSKSNVNRLISEARELIH